eukprot:GFUD01026720.1.p1 GENE.GFUD01026720.1~~GFUD01026720.1.p1  ORF type:complete len:102 (-),score=7.72 GFUD01026720.1:229-534(-)
MAGAVHKGMSSEKHRNILKEFSVFVIPEFKGKLQVDSRDNFFKVIQPAHTLTSESLMERTKLPKCRSHPCKSSGTSYRPRTAPSPVSWSPLGITKAGRTSS